MRLRTISSHALSLDALSPLTSLVSPLGIALAFSTHADPFGRTRDDGDFAGEYWRLCVHFSR